MVFSAGEAALLAKRERAEERSPAERVADLRRDPLHGVLHRQHAARAVDHERAAHAVAESLGIIWPNQDDRGTHVNVSGAGITKHAKHRANAERLLEYLVNAESQAWYAQINNEFPVVEGAKISSTLESWGSFKEDSVNLTQLGENNREAVKLMDRAGWR